MEERFSDKSVYQRFEAAIDRIDRKQRPPNPHEAGTLLRVLRTIKVGNFERATELLSRLNLVVPAFASHVGGRAAAGPGHDTAPPRQTEGDPDQGDLASRRDASWCR
jgi:hypothetical protein